MVRQRTHVRGPSPQKSPTRPLFYGGPDPITLNKMRDLVTNLRTMNSEWLERRGRGDPSQDPRRSLDAECGYPDGEWAAEDYHDLISREPLACLMNEFEALESWGVFPEVYDDEDEEVTTDFEYGWFDLPSMMAPEPNYFEEQKGSALYSLMLLADIHCGEGRHGAIVLGLKDGKGMSEPVTPRQGMQLQWARSFPEYMCRITSFDTDPKSPRYMHPMTYDVTYAYPRDQTGSGITEGYTTESVHWSRVVHIGDRWHSAPNSVNMMVPRLRPIRDPLLDYRKVRASDAEGYYKAAFVGLHFGTHPQLGADVYVDTDSLKDMYEEYINGLQRAIFTNGMTVDSIAPGVSDPAPHLLAQVQAMCMKKRVPMRILMGSERGELASGDDKLKWNNTMRSRQHNHNTSSILAPFANRLVNLGVLPKPLQPNKSGTRKGGAKCHWPDLASRTEKERVDILLTRTQAYQLYVANDIGSVIPPLDFMTKFDNFPPEEAQVIIDSAEEQQLQDEQDAQDLADEMGMEPAPPEGFQHPEPPAPTPEEEHRRALELEQAKAKASGGTQ